ncbi:MAG: putative lipid II flippase FtsW [Elusimicrobiaceae bacterium]|nr:putative lipid II flippase FtsW [Elusimicrobiaceae bacterium]
MKKWGQLDFGFLITVFALLAFGLIMVMSASSESARNAAYTGGDAYYFIKRQLAWAVLSVIAMYFFANFDYHKLVGWSQILIIVAIVLLLAVLVIGTEANGGQRWLPLGPISFQPSEFVKIALILYLAGSITKNKKYIDTFSRGLVPNLIVIGVISVLLILQPHFSATVLIVAVGVIMLFVGGVNWKHLAAIGVPVVSLGALLILTSDYRRARLFSFANPFLDPLGDGYQVVQSLYAIGSGGLFGLGLGQSRQKFLYIPEPQNDFIFSILCEEMGFVGALVVILVFVFLIFRGIKIAMTAKDKEGSLIAVGITSLIALEVIMNIAVVTAAMPVTGIPLPFFSYGGTSLLIIMACMGIMLNIARQSKN